VTPVALALAEQRGLSGRAVLEALLLGMEVECRIGLGVAPGHYDRGWHITSTTGVFGAAAAAAKLIGLDAARTAHALGLAASQSSGIIENLPNAGKNASMGNAARNGLLAALLAEAGWEAAPTAIEGRNGWARAWATCRMSLPWRPISARAGRRFASPTSPIPPASSSTR
jgi:2-methylcitrate dehydratase PrpD